MKKATTQNPKPLPRPLKPIYVREKLSIADLRVVARVSPAGSRWIAVVEGRRSRTATSNASTPTSTAPTTPEESDEYLPPQMLADIEVIAAFLAVEKPAVTTGSA